MATIQEALAIARRHQQAGDFAYAEQVYRCILEAEPNHADAWCGLGTICLATGRMDEAAASLQRAAQLRRAPPKETPRHEGMATQPEARSATATGSAEAEPAASDLALDRWRLAVQLMPQLADAHYDLALALAGRGKTAEAVASYQRAVQIKPSYTQAWNNLAILLRDQGKLDEALAACRQALAFRPDLAEAHNNMGLVLASMGRVAEAEECHRQALRWKPDAPENHNNLAIALRDQGKLEEALTSYGEALRLSPDYADGHLNRSLVWLLQGDFTRGWREYEWRWRKDNYPPRSFHQPWWTGSSLEKQRILLHAEQGLGDTIQFIRFAPLVKDRGGTVILECQESLAVLLARSTGVDQVVARASPLPDFEGHAPLMSLPGILGIDLDTIPARVPYLFPDRTFAERWRRELRSIPGFTIGIAWQGNPEFLADRFRSVPLTHFAALAELEGVRLISLQKGWGIEQVPAFCKQFPVVDLGARLESFEDTAAVLRNLNLVVTVDTALAHAAGALGVPVWLAVHPVPDWRWLLGREDSPWYPSLRLIRQVRLGDWQETFARMAAEIKQIVAVTSST